MLRKSFLFLGLLFLAVVKGSEAQAVERSGTWSARSNAGLTLAGTWTAIPDTSGAVTGTWRLVNEEGRTVASGGWAAAKSPGEWSGGWRAVVYGSNVEHAGTWSSSVDLKRNAPFADLFEKAMKTIVNGNWRSGGHSGGWSIQAFK